MNIISNLVSLASSTIGMVLLALIIAVIVRLCGGAFKKTFKRLLWLALLPLLLWSYGTLIERNRFSVVPVEISSSNLPESFNGYRIVHISDLHLASFEGRNRALIRAVNKINEQNPDLILFTGDLITISPRELGGGLQEILSELKAKDGVYAILGNHDFCTYGKWKSKGEQAYALEELKMRIAKMGWKLLSNSNIHITKNAVDSISLIGIDNISTNKHFNSYGDLGKAMEGVSGQYKILMSHDPSLWRAEILGLPDGIDLTLSGHTHAMQFSLPGWSPSALLFDEYRGLYTEGEQALYVNIGLGETFFTARIGAVPEITVLNL
ncbi:MAG: metallophosphoesterase, partial [Rikenellaceae bacterium]|nr:metallophosphoesterase [Rikenellaceae bacterium]